MPHVESETQCPAESATDQLQRLPFPPVTYSHILHCSYHDWLPKYRTLVPKSRAIPISAPFLDYLRSDSIVLPPEDKPPTDDDADLDSFSDDDVDETADPSTEWRDLHNRVKNTIAEFGGKVTPKLNWSAPKDATWIAATNDTQCRSPNDVYLLLKSSDFVTHDLEHAFDDCVPDPDSSTPVSEPEIPYHLVLRKYVNFNPSLEFRCFVRNRKLLCMCQRDQNHYDFLFDMRDSLRSRIQSFFDEKLKNSFPEPNFVFDVYVPAPHQRVWLVDINPWAERTDPLLFSWLEILRMKDPVGFKEEDDLPEGSFVRLSLNGNNTAIPEPNPEDEDDSETESDEEEEDPADDDMWPFLPEFRLIKRDDPEAYAFTSPQYSAHKMPKEVVDASLAGPGGMSEFLGKWQDILAKQVEEDEVESDE